MKRRTRTARSAFGVGQTVSFLWWKFLFDATIRPMAIPADELQRYTDFSVELTRDLKSIAIPPDTILWHYTSGSGLLGIINSMSVFSTHISCLNDTSEFRYSSVLFREALASLRGSYETDPIALAFLDAAVGYFAENPDYPAYTSVNQFVACFSEEENDLSQWRAYGGGENGYAVGFRARDLWGCENSMLARVSYDENLHRQLAKKAAEATVRFFLEGLAKCAPSEKAKWGEEFLEAWQRAISLVAPLVKDPAFAKERECRIVKSIGPGDFAKLRFMQKGSLICRHLPLSPPLLMATDPYRLPIARIMVGPCRHPIISRNSIETLLKQKGYPATLVSISKIPYQVT